MDFQPFLQNTSLLLNNYIDVKNALVSSNSKAATKTISTLFNLVKKEENFAQKAELLKATEKLFKIGNNLGKQI